MVEITTAAAQALQQALDGEGIPADQAFRLSPGENGQIALSQSASKEDGDLQLNHGERPVVFVEPTVAAALSDHTLDLVPAEDGMRLTVRPNG